MWEGGRNPEPCQPSSSSSLSMLSCALSVSSSWTFDETVAEQKCPENGSKRVKKDKVERVRGVFFWKIVTFVALFRK